MNLGMDEKLVPNLAFQIVDAASSRNNQVWNVGSYPFLSLTNKA